MSASRLCCLHVPSGLAPTPVPTAPVFLRSMCQLASSPLAFLRTKAYTPLPCLMASARSASLALMAALMASKAAEEGKLSVAESVSGLFSSMACVYQRTVLERHGCW